MDRTPEIILAELSQIPDAECSCDLCKQMCKLPCWGTPDEIRKLMDLGYGPRLMYDYWVGNFRNDENDNADIGIISVAEKGREGEEASSWRDEGCTFQMENGLCEIHTICKPVEGRKGGACENAKHPVCDTIHADVARLWDTPEGRAVVAEWYKKYHKTYEW